MALWWLLCNQRKETRITPSEVRPTDLKVSRLQLEWVLLYHEDSMSDDTTVHDIRQTMSTPSTTQHDSNERLLLHNAALPRWEECHMKIKGDMDVLYMFNGEGGKVDLRQKPIWVRWNRRVDGPNHHYYFGSTERARPRLQKAKTNWFTYDLQWYLF